MTRLTIGKLGSCRTGKMTGFVVFDKQARTI
jgi:hypothetical protein